MPKVPIKELPGHTHWYLFNVLAIDLVNMRVFVFHDSCYLYA